MSHLIRTCLKQLEKVKENNLVSFLDKEIEVSYTGPYSMRFGVSKDLLLTISRNSSCQPPFLTDVPVMLLIEMNQFRERRQLTYGTLLKWLHGICGEFEGVSENSLRQVVNKLKKELTALQRRRSAESLKRLQDFKDKSSLNWLPNRRSFFKQVTQEKKGFFLHLG